MTKNLPALIVLIVLTCALAPHATAQARNGTVKRTPPPPSGREIEIEEVRAVIPDMRVRTHENKDVRLYSDLVKNKVVLMGFFYARCSYICGMQGRNLALLQDRLGARLGKDVFMILISMDPYTDTAERLKGRAAALKLKPGWTLVSSTDPEMIKMIKDFTGNGPGPRETHSSAVFIGNDRAGRWMVEDGLSDPAALVKALDRVARATPAGIPRS